MSDVFDRWAGADADAEVLARLREEVARHWKLVLGIGVVSILAGAFAILARRSRRSRSPYSWAGRS
jgi:hypothetical protein